jgi:hypothetical protein
MGEMRKSLSTVFWKLEGKRPIGRPRRRGENNIKVDLRGNWLGE